MPASHAEKRSPDPGSTVGASVSALHDTHAWHPGSWRSHDASQQPEWPDTSALDEVLDHLSSLPALVHAAETDRLSRALAAASAGRAFLLQAGDCSESFSEFSARSIETRLRVILQMAVVLTYGAGLPVIKVGRIAGQFAKPRSAPTEIVGGHELPSFRGHMVNSEQPDERSRIPDATRLLAAYHQSAATLNLLRAFAGGGFADLRQVHAWNLEFVQRSTEGDSYDRLASEIDRALRFMAACGIELATEETLHHVEIWTSHEALLLDYEEALVRRDSLTRAWYGSSGHLLWVGERTRQADGAHVEFLRGIANPVAAKIGPSSTPDEVIALCDRLDPDYRPGRLTLITRLGVKNVERALPPIVQAVSDSGHPVVWACDPMHGNTFAAADGRKTRRFDDIIDEIRGFFTVHRDLGTFPGGIHIELTGDDVTECLGGAANVGEEHLRLRYTTTCDPRLNARQAIDLAFQVADLLAGAK